MTDRINPQRRQLLAASLCDGAEAIQRVGLRPLPAAVNRLLETLGITSVRGIGLTALPEQGALPPEHVGDERIRTNRSEHCQGVVVKTKRPGSLLNLFR